LRNPADRLISAYEFQKATGTLKPGDINFRSFLNRLRNSSVANYQTRLLSSQSWDGIGQRKGWDINPWSIDLEAENLFLGTVELFDESMILLEKWLMDRGVEFDASYQSAANISNKKNNSKEKVNSELIYQDMIEVDQILWEKVSDQVSRNFSRLSSFETELSNFKLRCTNERNSLRIIGPDEFIRI
jgi:hypothetical protein